MSSNSTSAHMQTELTPDGGRFWLLAIIFILCAINYANTRWSKFPLPVIERTWRQMLQYSSPAVELVERGYSTIIKQLGRPFRLWYWGQEYIILPLEYLIDVKRADKEHLSFLKSISDIFFLKYWISDLFETERMVYTVKKGLNPRLNETTQICIDEAADAFLQEFGQCDDFTSAGAVEAFCGIAHRIASVILISKKVSEDPAFKKASYSYFQGHAITGGLLLFLPLGPLRHYLAGPISYFQRVRQRRVLSIVAAEFQERLNGAVSGETHIDGIEWTIKMLKEFPGKPGEPLPLFQMSHELVHILGAAHTPVGMTLTQMVWQMLVQPEYLHALRKEAEEAVAKVGFTDRIVEYLPLQDSYIREANRLYPSNIVGTQRIVCGAPFVFSDGFTLPVGSRIAFPVGPYLRDSDVYSRPDEFDGERFVKLGNADARTEDGVNRWAASHAHKHNLAFGYGNHVCPGRFFAVRLIKVIFTKLILEYDIRSEWKGDGVPPSWNLEGSIISHTSARISLKKRKSH